jgi:NADH-quinone oxidoreductase subunit E
MLKAEERAEIEAEFAHYPNCKAACIDAMKIVQKHRGWLSDDALSDIGELLGMSAADLDSVATFYNLLFRQPVGRHVIYLCDSVSCWIMGSDQQRSHISERLKIAPGGTTPDGRFTLIPIVCLGACDHAPVMMIDDDTHFDVSAEKIDRILERYT